VPVRLEAGRAEAGQVPVLLRGLVAGAGGRPAAAGAGPASSAVAVLAGRLAGVPAAEQDAVVLELVVAHVAVVLGYGSPGLVGARREFHELGFDSLTAIELRNRLNAATGLRLLSHPRHAGRLPQAPAHPRRHLPRHTRPRRNQQARKARAERGAR
jgi:hypothetical protein